MNSDNLLERIKEANKENQRPVTVNVGLLKSAASEIKAHVAINGKGLMTDMVINALETAIREGKGG